MAVASRSRPQVVQTMTAVMIRLTTGSSQSQPVRRIVSPAGRVRSHVKERALDVDVALPTGREQQRRRGIDGDADARDDHHYIACDGLGIAKSLKVFDGDCPCRQH